MNREDLIKGLMQHELRQFTFSIWSRFNDETSEFEYTYTLKGSMPSNYSDFITDVGGYVLDEGEYDYNTIEFIIFGY